MDATVVMGQQGRVVIPAAVRAELELEPGTELRLRVEGGRVVLERPTDAIAALKALGARIPAGRSLVDELIEERRAEAARE
ncbi:MAG TPA: AbrB/MazE/SpoVT family DNA-binding domain-containing protein [Mycobacteriales bacterium]|nr:AbrB/MazE/SpoVT family DNA-binding domain-containing protein [Mycobacteriales bacterium]